MLLLLIVSVLPLPGGVKTFFVQSGSMEPAIRTGSIVVTRPAESYKIGDVITYNSANVPGTLVTHRIIEIREKSGGPVYLTKGDANDTGDGQEILRSSVIGKVAFSIPYMGYAVAAAKQPTGFLVLIVVPAGVIIIDESRKVWREIARLRKQRKEQGKSVAEV